MSVSNRWSERRSELGRIVSAQQYELQSALLDALASKWADDLDRIAELEAENATLRGGHLVEGEVYVAIKIRAEETDSDNSKLITLLFRDRSRWCAVCECYVASGHSEQCPMPTLIERHTIRAAKALETKP